MIKRRPCPAHPPRPDAQPNTLATNTRRFSSRRTQTSPTRTPSATCHLASRCCVVLWWRVGRAVRYIMDANARITYVNGRGRAELIRFLLSAAGVPFTEQFVESKADLVALRESGKLLFNQLPLLEINSLCITQSAAMARYIARNYNLYGASEEERVLCDQIFDAIVDSADGGKITLGFPFQSDKEAAAARQKVLHAKYFPLFTRILEKNGSGFLVGSQLTFVDVALMHDLEWYVDIEGEEVLDGFDELKAHFHRVRAVPGIAAYIAGDQKKAFPDEKYLAVVQRVFR